MRKLKTAEQVKIGTLVGRRRIIKIMKRGPYTHVDVECSCSTHAVRRNIPLAQIIRGRALSCGCWFREIREAEQIEWEKFRAAWLRLRTPIQQEREKVMKRFFPLYTPRRQPGV